jgi:hypothetical protein
MLGSMAAFLMRLAARRTPGSMVVVGPSAKFTRLFLVIPAGFSDVLMAARPVTDSPSLHALMASTSHFPGWLNSLL